VFKTKKMQNLKTGKHKKRKGSKMRKNKGFTLVEILIVVVILGILAAIVIPQFTDASTQSKVSSCRTTLQSLRSQIELYKIQHNDVTPGNVAGALDTAVWEAQMTTYSDAQGNTNATKTAVFCYGPYIQQVPFNPWNDSQSIAAADALGVGWVYNVTTGSCYVGVLDLAATNPTVAQEIRDTGDAL
jgi:general secretion pathway protein G